ncbi:protocadherin alpha-C1-like [Rhinatrema bivittatum]|uniref:protocadherin alpha-C1-like n=1 Tax=Rhinatrema bivittatum TaxID=194408 RepID=UPI001129170F|nr:protocadherin alpha-C1-like [Rhinatrema bivittatum]
MDLVLLLCLIFYTVNGQIEYTIPEETEYGKFVGNVAKDLGIDAATLILRKFRIISSSSKQYFNVDTYTGILSVNELIDREEICGFKRSCLLNYELVLENPLELHKLRVKILDINDNSPRFPLNEYSLNIAEFLSAGARFTLPDAHDPDEGTNSVQTYTISSNDHFRLEIQTLRDGSKYPELVLDKALDRELLSTHRLVITAIDGGEPQRNGNAQIIVTVLDTNDNAPVFENSVYTATVAENSPKGTLVTQVHATDLDEGQNGEVLYAFRSSTPQELQDLFLIDAETGEIQVNGILDAEESVVEMYIEARDKGAFGMFSTAKVIVQISGINNNAPEVVITSLSSPVPENALPGTVIALLSIVDKDLEENGQVTCQIPANIPFQLRSSFDNYYTLVTNGSLDREAISQYNITVTATDLGSPPISVTKVVRIEISDVNDNPPQFSKPSLDVFITENNPPGALLCMVSAFDPDLGTNGHVSYTLREGEINGISIFSYIALNSEHAGIYAMRSFDFEELQDLQFQIEAKDGGTPTMSTILTVNMFIVDQNDNAPIILYPATRDGSVAVEIVPRQVNADYLVTKVVAHDADRGQNAWLSFHIVQSSDSSLFKISPATGELRTTRSIQSTDAIKQKLVILVKDSGEPAKSSTVIIGILFADSIPQSLPNFDDVLEPQEKLTNLNLYLIISLASISLVFLGFLIFLVFLKVYQFRTNSYATYCPLGCCILDDYDKYQSSVQVPQNPQLITSDLVEINGGGTLSGTCQYKTSLELGPGNNNLLLVHGENNFSDSRNLKNLHFSKLSVQAQKTKEEQFNVILVVSNILKLTDIYTNVLCVSFYYFEKTSKT